MIGMGQNCIYVPGTIYTCKQAIIKMEQQPIKKPKSKLRPAIKLDIILGPCIPLIPSDTNIFFLFQRKHFAKEESKSFESFSSNFIDT